jgi:tetratricopeptide (TPR) repeat protein
VKALEESVRLAVDDTQQKAKFLNTLGTAYLALRPAEPEKAVKALKEAVEIDPDQASRAMSLNTLGTAYLALRPAQAAEAVKALEESVRLAVDDTQMKAKILNTLGKAYLKDGHSEAAVAKLQESLKLLQDSYDTRTKATAYNLLGQSYEKLPGKQSEAIAAYRAAEALNRGPRGDRRFAEMMAQNAARLEEELRRKG